MRYTNKSKISTVYDLDDDRVGPRSVDPDMPAMFRIHASEDSCGAAACDPTAVEMPPGGMNHSDHAALGVEDLVVSRDEFRNLIAISHTLAGAVVRLYAWAAVAGERLGIEQEPLLPPDTPK